MSFQKKLSVSHVAEKSRKVEIEKCTLRLTIWRSSVTLARASGKEVKMQQKEEGMVGDEAETMGIVNCFYSFD